MEERTLEEWDMVHPDLNLVGHDGRLLGDRLECAPIPLE